MCGCSHASGLSAVVILPGFAVATWVYFSEPRGGIVRQIFSLVPYVMIGLMCVKVIADFLCFGHDPLLR